MTTVSDYLLERLREWNVENIFGYPGDGINGIVGALSKADNKPEFIQSRHEEMSAFEAVGYAKFSGRPGCACRRLGQVRSTCSTACTTPSWTTCRSWPSSARRIAPPWAGATSKRST